MAYSACGSATSHESRRRALERRERRLDRDAHPASSPRAVSSPRHAEAEPARRRPSSARSSRAPARSTRRRVARDRGPQIDVQQQRRIAHRPRERPDLVERRCEGDQPVARHPPVGRLEPDDAAERRRLADRAARVRARARAAPSRAATAAADPPLDPPGIRVGSHGFRVAPNAEFSVDEPIANSSQFVLPTMTAPAASSRSTTVAS